jgi:hypothetical protein
MGNPSITRWVREICLRHKLSAFYLPNKDTYLIHFRGKALQGFNSQVFYQIPKDAREKSLTPILKRGLMLNMNEKHREQLYTKKRLGRTIVK